jgi:hypothetical protein
VKNDRADGLKKMGAPLIIFASAAALFLAAWALWFTHNEKAQGAAITLIGVMASHLIKEVQQLLRSWLREDNPIGETPESERDRAAGTISPKQ